MKLAQLVSDYLAFKKSLGMRFRSETATLRSFCRTLGDIEIEEVRPRSVLPFLAGKGVVTRHWHQKFKILRGFYRFAMARGYVDFCPLPETIPKPPPSLVPYIYSREEILRLLDATQTLENPMSPLQATTFRTLLLSLYGTGLRISEALSLTLTDVDLSEALMVVRNTKFFKTRLVPIGPDLVRVLSAYSVRRRRLPRPAGEDSAFFATRSGKALSYDRVNTIFQILRTRACIHREKEARYQPRIHDLRATFAVHRLLAWYRDGRDVQRLLPQLSTYLGHVEIADTQRYLCLTPELLQEANCRFERYALEVNHA